MTRAGPVARPGDADRRRPGGDADAARGLGGGLAGWRDRRARPHGDRRAARRGPRPRGGPADPGGAQVQRARRHRPDRGALGGAGRGAGGGAGRARRADRGRGARGVLRSRGSRGGDGAGPAGDRQAMAGRAAARLAWPGRGTSTRTPGLACASGSPSPAEQDALLLLSAGWQAAQGVQPSAFACATGSCWTSPSGMKRMRTQSGWWYLGTPGSTVTSPAAWAGPAWAAADGGSPPAVAGLRLGGSGFRLRLGVSVPGSSCLASAAAGAAVSAGGVPPAGASA